MAHNPIKVELISYISGKVDLPELETRRMNG